MYGDPDRGGGEDAGVWYKCWYCHQLNNINKSTLGGPDSTDGVVYVDYAETPDRAGVAEFGGISNSFTAQLNGSDGNPVPVKNAICVSNEGSGCSFCGSKNYRGDY